VTLTVVQTHGEDQEKKKDKKLSSILKYCPTNKAAGAAGAVYTRNDKG